MSEQQPAVIIDPSFQQPLPHQDEAGRLNSDVNPEMMAVAANTHVALEEEKARLIEQGGPGGYTRESTSDWANRMSFASIGRKSEDPNSGLDLEAYKRVGGMIGEAQDINKSRDELIAARIDVSSIPMENLPQAVKALRSYQNSEQFLSRSREQLQQAESMMARDTEALSLLPMLPEDPVEQS